MKIVSFVYCDNIDTDNNIINGPISMITPVALPSNYSFSLFIGIYDYDKCEDASLKAEFIDAKGTVISVIDGLIPTAENSGVELGGDKPVCMNLGLHFNNVELISDGTYHTSVEIDGEILGSYEIEVCLNDNHKI